MAKRKGWKIECPSLCRWHCGHYEDWLSRRIASRVVQKMQLDWNGDQ